MNKNTMVKIAYIGGGSTGWAKKLMSDLLLQDKMSGTLHLYDIDLDAAIRNKNYFDKLINLNHEIVKSDWKIIVAFDSKSCLENADFVVMSITPGTLKNMGNDIHYPEKYKIYQSVGDTVGVGGYSRALRTIPIYIDYAKQIELYCPEAWVINYTNPMSICTLTLYETFPGIKAFGCCHEVFKSQELLLEAYKEIYPETSINRIKDVKINLQGINHFTWISEAKLNRVNILDIYNNFVALNKDNGYDLDKGTDSFKEASGTFKFKLKSLERVKMDLYSKYGLMAAAGDRHLAEFIPSTYLKNPETVEKWDFHLTHIKDRYSSLEEKIKIQLEVINGTTIPELEPSDEEGVNQMLAILGYDDMVTNVNLPNVGQISNLTIGGIVETNAYFANDTVKPIMSGAMNSPVQEMVSIHLKNQIEFVKSYILKDAYGIFKVFRNDPSTELLNDDQLQNLFKEIVILNAEFNEKWIIDSVENNKFYRSA